VTAELTIKLLFSAKLHSHINGVVTSRSMEPLLQPKMTVTVQKVRYSDLKVGNIICFYNQTYTKRKNRLVVHRIIQIDHNKKLITTKGDNRTVQDAPIKFDDIIGKCVSLQRHGRRYCFSDIKVRFINQLFTFMSYIQWKSAYPLPFLYQIRLIIIKSLLGYPNICEMHSFINKTTI
jgi:signal peptidase I